MNTSLVHFFKTRFSKLTLALIGFAIVVSPMAASALTVSPVRVELVGDAGKVVTSEIQLFNEQTTDNTFYFSFANFEAQGETGTPNFVEATSGLATWIHTPESIVLKAGEQKKIPISITIPEGTQPGGYFAGIFLSTTPTKTNGGGEVSIGAKIGILTLLRVNGEVKEGGGILSFGTKDDSAFFTSLPISFLYRFQNGGSDRVKPDGTITVRNMLGIKSATLNANPADGNILPLGSIRKFDVVWDREQDKDKAGNTSQADQNAAEDLGFFEKVSHQWNHFAFGRYSAHLELSYGSQKTSMKTAVWVFPWHLFLVIILPLILLILIFKFAAHRYNQWVILQAEHMLEAEHHWDHTTAEPTKKKVVKKRVVHAKKK